VGGADQLGAAVRAGLPEHRARVVVDGVPGDAELAGGAPGVGAGHEPVSPALSPTARQMTPTRRAGAIGAIVTARAAGPRGGIGRVHPGLAGEQLRRDVERHGGHRRTTGRGQQGAQPGVASCAARTARGAWAW
jgi:hypothetical protein